MSHASPEKYNYRVCPTCKSKKLEAIAVVDMGARYYKYVDDELQRTGYLCGNCGRYHLNSERKYVYDRAEMRRDIARLQKFLDGEQS